MKISSSILLLCFSCLAAYGQHDPGADMPAAAAGVDSLEDASVYAGAVTMEGIATSDKMVPFWMRSNQYGSIPLDGLSVSLLAGYSRRHHADKRLLDWGFSLQGRMNLASRTSQFQLIEASVDGKFSIFQLKVGRARNITGLTDSSLSSGAFVMSGNALGIPQVELSMPEYWNIPLTSGVLAFKGNFVHGWIGKVALRRQQSRVASANAYFHQKSLYGRLGKEVWRVQFYGGFNHQVMWGGEKQINGPAYTLSAPETFVYVFTGQAYGKSGVPTSKIGNHIGSVDQAVSVRFNKFSVLAYHQFFYEVGGLYHLNNIKDGLWGLSITNRNAKDGQKSVGWHKLLIEIWNSKSQGGELDAPKTPSGDEDYYNNYIYAQGWAYLGENLGNPLLTSRRYARTDLVAKDYQYFINNRVQAIHIGADFFLRSWDAKVLLTCSRNYGTWGSDPIGNSGRGLHYPGPPPYFEAVDQFSGYLEVGRPIGNDFRLGVAVAVDQGKLLYNSIGGLVKLSRSL